MADEPLRWPDLNAEEKQVFKQLSPKAHEKLSEAYHRTSAFASCREIWDTQVLDWYFHLTDPQSHEAIRRLSQAGPSPDHGAHDPAGRANSDAGPGAETDGDSAQFQHSQGDDENDISAK